MLKFFRSFRKSEDGSLSIEALFWMVTTVTVAALFIDGSSLFQAQSNIMRIMHEANRAYSVGYIDTPEKYKAYILAQLTPRSPGAQVETVEDEDILVTRVTVPARDFQILGVFASLNTMQMGFVTKHVIEDWDA